MQIINRTPHPITITPTGTASEAPVVTLPAAKRGEVARVETTSRVISQMYNMQDDGSDATPVPVTSTSWGRVIGLPKPSQHVVHVVSAIVAAAAHAEGRTLDDLYVPGDQVRDDTGRIVGCSSLTAARFALPGEVLLHERLEDVAARHRRMMDMLSMRDWSGTADEVQPVNTRRRVGVMNCDVAYLCHCHDVPRGYGGWWLVVWEHGPNGWCIYAADPEHLAGVNLTPDAD